MSSRKMSVLKVLKRDTVSTVMKALDVAKNLQVIIKKVPLSERACIECEILSQLDHPGIPKLLEKHVIDEILYLVMELKPGQSLKDVVQTRKFTESEVLHIVRQLVSIIQYLHMKAGVIHRDIKLENILIDEDNNISLVDFGFAGYLEDEMTERLGSPAYASPELIIGRPYSAPTDIWSMGVVTYCLLEGSLPFHGHTIDAVFKEVCCTHPPIAELTGLSPEGKSFLAQVLLKNQFNRLATEELLDHPWISGEKFEDKPMEADADAPYRMKLITSNRKSLPLFKPEITKPVMKPSALVPWMTLR